MKKKVHLIVGVLFCLTAAGAAVACLLAFVQAGASSSWPSAPGTITESRVDDNSVGPKELFKAHIRYSFQVGGARYSGGRIRMADTTPTRESAQRKLIEPYPFGAEVDVFYDPDDPKISVLIPGGGVRRYFLALPPIILAGIGGLLIYDSRQRAAPLA